MYPSKIADGEELLYILRDDFPEISFQSIRFFFEPCANLLKTVDCHEFTDGFCEVFRMQSPEV